MFEVLDRKGWHGPQHAFSAIQAGFWMSFCASVSFAVVYLQALGYSNGLIGLVMALGNLLGTLVAPALSCWVDREERVTAKGLIPWVLALQAVAVLVLLACPVQGWVTSVAYVSYIGFCTTVNCLNLKLYADAEHAGSRIDYAFTRGMGSVAYVLVSIALGFLVGRVSHRLVPAIGLALCAYQYLAFRSFARFVVEGEKAGPCECGCTSLADFARGNSRFCVLLLGIVLLYFGHSTACNFLINLTRHVGGGTEDMGIITGFKGAVEIPMMFLYAQLFRSGRHDLALRISAVAFVLKTVAFVLSGSVWQLTAAFVLQAPSYGLFMAAIVPYVKESVDFSNSAKAQSLAFSMTVVGGMLANLISGQLYDFLPVTTTLCVTLAVGLAGMVVTFLGTRRG